MEETLGKLVGSRRYFHTSALGKVDRPTTELVARAAAIAGVHVDGDFNVVRVDSLGGSVALLSYPGFFEDGCPTLACSWKVDIIGQRAALRSYRDSFNPPILHRKELLLEADDPHRIAFELLTVELEDLGCFDDPIRIGFKLQWERLLRERGFQLVGHQLVPIGNEEPGPDQAFNGPGPIEIARHLTALSRQNFSAPIQILQRFGFLDGSHTLFDYGCGKGDDLRGLLANGLQAAGWDPHYAPTTEVSPARIVNLGFVINVIEDPVERREALQRAFSLAEDLLVVSAMVATDNPGNATPYGDGVLTSRATFQKYYTQGELRDFLSSTLNENPISVAPGICFVFKDKGAEQRFQLARQRGRVRISPLARPPRIEIADRVARRSRAPDQYDNHQPLLAPLWAQCLELGREPDRDEVPNVAEIEKALGSLKKALRITLAHNNSTQLEQARSQRVDDLKVYLALQQFQRRKPYKTLELGLQRDIRTFFGDYTSAQEHAKQLLYQASQPEFVDECCRAASERGLGWLEISHSLQLHSSLVPRLPAPLRVYVGCAAVLYGDVTQADVVKIHIRSGKVSFLKYDDFFGKPIPRMVERAKINLRNLEFQLYTYGERYPPPPLFLKSRYMNEEIEGYAEQSAFDESLASLKIDLSRHGASANEFETQLRMRRWRVNGFQLERTHPVPGLDEKCGRFLSYRQLIQCGESQARSKVANLPQNPETYTALYDLATHILDPVIEYFGEIEITYGFCSSELARHVSGRVAPRLDQHAAHESGRNGRPVCARLGAAVDFLVRYEDMSEVADWIMSNLNFDRLYYYGRDRPIHVSYGSSCAGQAFELVRTRSGALLPRPLRAGNARSDWRGVR